MNEPWILPGQYSVSPHNFAPDLLAEYAFPAEIGICDGTFRKIDLVPGSIAPSHISVGDKVEIASLLNDAGIARVGFNPTHGRGTRFAQLARDGLEAIAAKGFKFKIECSVDFHVYWHGSDYREDIDWLVEIGTNIVLIEVPQVGHASVIEDWSWDNLRERPIAAFEYAKTRGVDAGIMLPALDLTDIGHALELVNYWIDHGVDLLWFSDQFGSMSPQATHYTFKRLRREMVRQVPMQFHCHNMFGMGTGSVAAAVAHGVWPEVSVNGIGDIGGLPDLAEVAVSLELLCGVRTGIKLEKLATLSKLVERITGIAVEPRHYRAVLGEGNYLPTRDEHFIPLVKGEPWGYTPLDPALVGLEPSLVWCDGMALTTAAVKAKLDQVGLPYSEDQVGEVEAAIRDRLKDLREFPAWIGDAEVEEICRNVLA